MPVSLQDFCGALYFAYVYFFSLQQMGLIRVIRNVKRDGKPHRLLDAVHSGPKQTPEQKSLPLPLRFPGQSWPAGGSLRCVCGGFFPSVMSPGPLCWGGAASSWDPRPVSPIPAARLWVWLEPLLPHLCWGMQTVPATQGDNPRAQLRGPLLAHNLTVASALNDRV